MNKDQGSKGSKNHQNIDEKIEEILYSPEFIQAVNELRSVVNPQKSPLDMLKELGNKGNNKYHN